MVRGGARRGGGVRRVFSGECVWRCSSWEPREVQKQHRGRPVLLPTTTRTRFQSPTTPFPAPHTPPQLKVYDLANLSLKFDRHMEAEVVDFAVLSEDYSKAAFLCADRSVSFHAKFGTYFKVGVFGCVWVCWGVCVCAVRWCVVECGRGEQQPASPPSTMHPAPNDAPPPPSLAPPNTTTTTRSAPPSRAAISPMPLFWPSWSWPAARPSSGASAWRRGASWRRSRARRPASTRAVRVRGWGALAGPCLAWLAEGVLMLA
jgi:hypothetical protein